MRDAPGAASGLFLAVAAILAVGSYLIPHTVRADSELAKTAGDRAVAISEYCDRAHAADSGQLKSIRGELEAEARSDAAAERLAREHISQAHAAYGRAIDTHNKSTAPTSSAESRQLSQAEVNAKQAIYDAEGKLAGQEDASKDHAAVRGAIMDCINARARQLSAPPPKPKAANPPPPPPPAVASSDTITSKGSYSETCYVGDANGVTTPGVTIVTLNTRTNAVFLAVRAFKNGVLSTYRGTLASPPDIEADKLPDGTTSWNGSLTLVYKSDKPAGLFGSGGNYRTDTAKNIKCNGDWEVKP